MEPGDRWSGVAGAASRRQGALRGSGSAVSAAAAAAQDERDCGSDDRAGDRPGDVDEVVREEVAADEVGAEGPGGVDLAHGQDHAEDHQRRRNDGVGAGDRVRERMAHHPAAGRHQDEEVRAEHLSEQLVRCSAPPRTTERRQQRADHLRVLRRHAPKDFMSLAMIALYGCCCEASDGICLDLLTSLPKHEVKLRRQRLLHPRA